MLWLRISNEAGLTQAPKNMRRSEGSPGEEVRSFFFHKEENRKSSRCKPGCFLFEDIKIVASIILRGITLIHHLPEPPRRGCSTAERNPPVHHLLLVLCSSSVVLTQNMHQTITFEYNSC